MSRDDFREESLALWGAALGSIFPDGIPASAKWTDLASIASVLNKVGTKPDSNHMFFPTGGGLDLDGASVLEEEPDNLALKTGERVREVVRPTVLLFESFGAEIEWAYFRLECESFPRTDVYEGSEGKNEEVVLLPGGEYAPRSAWDEDEYRGLRLSKSALLLVRETSGGPIVVFSKGSTYNLGKPDAYSGRHAKVSAEQFRDFIRRSAEAN